MKSYIMLLFTMLVLLSGFTSCSADDPLPETVQPIFPPDDDKTPENPDNENDDDLMDNSIKIKVGSVSFDATLENNPTAAAFKALLPMTVEMSEMNGNEKYYYLTGNLPVASSNPGTIRSGDLMLYGSSCVVLFYEAFRTSYSYTRLGRVDNASGLSYALGSGRVTVTFELQ